MMIVIFYIVILRISISYIIFDFISFLIEPTDDKESSNEMNEPRDSRCKKDSDCPKGEICSITEVLISNPPQPVYNCVKPNGNPKNPKQGISIKF